MAAIWTDTGSECKLQACAGLEGREAFLGIVAARSRLDRASELLETTDFDADGIAFCAAAALPDAAGMPVGTILIFDRRPRTLDAMDRAIFGSLRERVVGELVSQDSQEVSG